MCNCCQGGGGTNTGMCGCCPSGPPINPTMGQPNMPSASIQMGQMQPYGQIGVGGTPRVQASIPSSSNFGFSPGMNFSALNGSGFSEFGYHGIGYDMIGPGCCDGPGGLFSPTRPQGACCGCMPGPTMGQQPGAVGVRQGMCAGCC